MSLARFTIESIPTTNPAAWKVFMWIDSTGFYTLDENWVVSRPTANAIPVYWTELHLFENNNVVTDSTTAWVTIIDQDTNSLPIWKYELDISYNWSHDSTWDDFISELTFLGNNVSWNSAEIHRQEPQDTSWTFWNTGTDQKHWFTRKYYIDVTTAWVKNITLKMKSSVAWRKSSIWDTSIKLIRIS